jgi:hypothetical protein
MTKQHPDQGADATGRPIITKELAEQLVREGRELRREFRHRFDSMRNISSEQRQIRTR